MLVQSNNPCMTVKCADKTYQWYHEGNRYEMELRPELISVNINPFLERWVDDLKDKCPQFNFVAEGMNWLNRVAPKNVSDSDHKRKPIDFELTVTTTKVYADGEFIGELMVENTKPNTFGQDDLEVCTYEVISKVIPKRGCKTSTRKYTKALQNAKKYIRATPSVKLIVKSFDDVDRAMSNVLVSAKNNIIARNESVIPEKVAVELMLRLVDTQQELIETAYASAGYINKHKELMTEVEKYKDTKDLIDAYNSGDGWVLQLKQNGKYLVSKVILKGDRKDGIQVKSVNSLAELPEDIRGGVVMLDLQGSKSNGVYNPAIIPAVGLKIDDGISRDIVSYFIRGNQNA